MKYFLLSFLLISSMTSLVFAEEVETDCPQMREQNDRSNPKANMAASKPKPKQKSATSAQ